MRRYNFNLREPVGVDGVAQYSIEISALDATGMVTGQGLTTAIKRYNDEESYRRDVLVDFTSSFTGAEKGNQVVFLTDARAVYYGWQSIPSPLMV